MTINFSSSNNVGRPDHLPKDSPPLAGGDDTATHHAHRATGPGNVNAPDPASWHDVPSNEVGRSKHNDALPNGQVPLTLPPEDKTGGNARKNVTDKFRTLLEQSNDAKNHADQNLGGNNKLGDSNGGGDDGGGDGNDTKVPQKHFSIEDLLQLLVTESAIGFKLSAMQTQLATEQKVGALNSEVSEIRSAGKDREIGSILAGVGTMAAGAAQIAGAGISLKGVTAATSEIDATAQSLDNAASRPAGTDPNDIEMEDLPGGKGGGYKPLASEPPADESISDDPSVKEAETEKDGMSAIAKSNMFTRLTAKSQAISQVVSSLGQMTQGGMNLGQGIQESNAVKHDAAKTTDEKDAAIDDSLHDNAQNVKQQLMQAMQDYVERGKNLEQSQAQTMKDIMHSV